MSSVQLRRYEQILQNEISLVVARTDLSDVTDTSAFKHLLAATARELDEAYYQLTRLRLIFDLARAAGDDLDERAKEIQPGTIRRIQGRRAVDTVIFSRTSSVGDITIPTGTVVKTKDSKSFRTTSQATILNGNTDSESVSIIADVPGSAGNVAAGTIVRFGSKPAGVDAVVNTSGGSQGRDKEKDDAFRARIANYLSSLSRCTPQALEFVAVGTEDSSGKVVSFAHIFEDPIDLGRTTLYIDDGAGTTYELGTPVVDEVVTANLAGPPSGSAVGGEEFLDLTSKAIDVDGSAFTVESSIRGALTLGTEVYLNPASGRLYFSPPLVNGEIITSSYTPFAGLIQTVQKVVDGDVDDRENFPGYRAAGVLVRVLSPTVVTVPVEGVLNLIPKADRDTVIAAVNDAVMDYINNLGISGDVIRNALIERIMSVEGVADVVLSLPSGNQTILDNEIPRTNLDNVSFT